jgi:transposase InsO family protein
LAFILDPVPDKSADNIVHLILKEIYPRYGCPLQILTDNGTENVNKAVNDTLKELNINHITTSYYNTKKTVRLKDSIALFMTSWLRK